MSYPMAFAAIASLFMKSKANKELEKVMKDEYLLKLREASKKDYLDRLGVHARGTGAAVRAAQTDIGIGAEQARSDLENRAIRNAQIIKDRYGVGGQEAITQHFLPEGGRGDRMDKKMAQMQTLLKSASKPAMDTRTLAGVRGVPFAWETAYNKSLIGLKEKQEFDTKKIAEIYSKSNEPRMADAKGKRAVENIERRQGAMTKALSGDVNTAEQNIAKEMRDKSQDVARSQKQIARLYDIPEGYEPGIDSSAYQKAKGRSEMLDAGLGIASNFGLFG